MTIRKPKKLVQLVVMIAGSLLIGVFGYQLWLKSGGVFRLEKFDRVRWLQEGRNYNVRECRPGAYMAHDIITRVIKEGMLRREVVAILGGPDPGDSAKLVYRLGMCLNDEDEQDLTIFFDNTDKVSRMKIQ